jgi:two-component system, NarL family, response regulator NreC
LPVAILFCQSRIPQGIRSITHRGTYIDKIIPQPIVAKAFQESMTAGPLDRLSVRERHVLQLVVDGNSTAEIAQALLLSPKTVETYRSRIKQKLNLRTLPDLVKFAIRHGLITLD